MGFLFSLVEYLACRDPIGELVTETRVRRWVPQGALLGVVIAAWVSVRYHPAVRRSIGVEQYDSRCIFAHQLICAGQSGLVSFWVITASYRFQILSHGRETLRSYRSSVSTP